MSDPTGPDRGPRAPGADPAPTSTPTPTPAQGQPQLPHRRSVRDRLAQAPGPGVVGPRNPLTETTGNGGTQALRFKLTATRYQGIKNRTDLHGNTLTDKLWHGDKALPDIMIDLRGCHYPSLRTIGKLTEQQRNRTTDPDHRPSAFEHLNRLRG